MRCLTLINLTNQFFANNGIKYFTLHDIRSLVSKQFSHSLSCDFPNFLSPCTFYFHASFNECEYIDLKRKFNN